MGELLEIESNISKKKLFFSITIKSDMVKDVHIVIMCHFILYVKHEIVYISVKRIRPSNIPFCVH